MSEKSRSKQSKEKKIPPDKAHKADNKPLNTKTCNCCTTIPIGPDVANINSDVKNLSSDEAQALINELGESGKILAL